MVAAGRLSQISRLWRYSVSAAAVVTALCGSASAQTAPADIAGRLTQGEQISVVDEQGRQFKGRLVRVAAEFLTIEKGRRQTDVRYQEVVKIDRVDDLKKGATIGALIGAGLFALDALVAREGGLTLNAAGYLVIGGMYCGLGSGIGAGVDALIGGNRTLYQRGATRVRVGLTLRDRAAAVVGISW